MLKDKPRYIGAADFAALMSNLVTSVTDPKIGFNHASTDFEGWMRSFAPVGVKMDEAFLEDLLYASNMVNEVKKFRHPQGRTFQEMLKSILGSSTCFDLDTNSIIPRGKQQ